MSVGGGGRQHNNKLPPRRGQLSDGWPQRWKKKTQKKTTQQSDSKCRAVTSFSFDFFQVSFSLLLIHSATLCSLLFFDSLTHRRQLRVLREHRYRNNSPHNILTCKRCFEADHTSKAAAPDWEIQWRVGRWARRSEPGKQKQQAGPPSWMLTQFQVKLNHHLFAAEDVHLANLEIKYYRNELHILVSACERSAKQIDFYVECLRKKRHN